VTLTRHSLIKCRTKQCPFSPDEHDEWMDLCSRAPEHGHRHDQLTHQHHPKKGMGGNNPLSKIVSIICWPMHDRIDNKDWGNDVKDIPWRGRVYFAWDIHGNTLIEREVLSDGAEAAFAVGTAPNVSGTGGSSAPSPSTKEESDGQEDELDTAAISYRGNRKQHRSGDSLTESLPLTHEQRVAPLDDWCRRGMGFVYNGERLESLTDEWRFQVGEWLNEGEGMMPEEVHGYLRGFRSPMALRQYAWVAGVVTRVTGLSWTHHRAVAALPAPERQEKLEKALVEGFVHPGDDGAAGAAGAALVPRLWGGASGEVVSG